MSTIFLVLILKVSNHDADMHDYFKSGDVAIYTDFLIPKAVVSMRRQCVYIASDDDTKLDLIRGTADKNTTNAAIATMLLEIIRLRVKAHEDVMLGECI